jgi:RimJ/RimL family protein N-acetyltransferase
VEFKETGELIGEAKLGKPNEQKIAHTDIKLLPEFWGNRYGIEIKNALVSYLFEKTEALVIEATPNIYNIASIKMQEAAGYKRIRREIHHFPDTMRDKTEPVEYFIYRLDKKDWKK